MGPIKPGDRFFRVQNVRRRADTDWIVVTKVGRKWVEFVRESFHARNPSRADWNDGRFEIETFVIDGARFSSPGRVYATEEEYRTEHHTQALWFDFRKQVDRAWNAPDKIGSLDILKAADALCFRLKEE